MRIIDCFIFNDEYDHLELRLRTLADTVDMFVLVESAHSFQGRDKPLHWLNVRDDERWAPWRHQIVHVPVYDSPDPNGDPGGVGSPLFMVRENHQRAAIARGLYDIGDITDDLVIIGDVDEIARPESIDPALEALSTGARFVELMAETYVWASDLRYPALWHTTTAAFGRHADPVPMRAARATPDVPTIERGSWHFTWQGGADAAWRKLNSFSHVEVLAKYKGPADFAQRIADRLDVHGVALDLVPLDDSYPAPMQAGFLDHWRYENICNIT